jgi:hypothetical protein
MVSVDSSSDEVRYVVLYVLRDDNIVKVKHIQPSMCACKLHDSYSLANISMVINSRE